MELTVLEAVNAGGNVGLLMIGVALMKMERRVLRLEWQMLGGKNGNKKAGD